MIKAKRINHALYFFILFSFLSTKVIAQTVSSIFPTFQSPNAAAFEQYGITPVSTYTGIPNINIPIYELRVDNISVPISLSYHASGIKIEQDASWVGLGWNLNVGGVITRQIKGLADINPLPLEDGRSSCRNRNYIGPYQSDIDGVINHTTVSHDFYEDYYDSEPDIFTYNFNGYVGQFVIDPITKKAIIINGSRDLNISYYKSDRASFNLNTYDIYTFEFNLPNGIKYIFRNTEWETLKHGNTEAAPPNAFADYNTGNAGPMTHTTAWCLSEIHSINNPNHWVKFSYNTSPKLTSYSPVDGTKMFPFDDLNTYPLESYSQTKIERVELTLSQIVTSEGSSIDFIPNQNSRTDIPNSTALGQINVKYGNNTIHTTVFNLLG
jgi:hypothetical protein